MDKAQAGKIRDARLVANPGCYPTGAIGLIRPLRQAGILPDSYPVTVNAVSGYTGGGKQMIAQMEDPAESGSHRLAAFPLRPDAQAQACAGDADPRPA